MGSEWYCPFKKSRYVAERKGCLILSWLNPPLNLNVSIIIWKVSQLLKAVVSISITYLFSIRLKVSHIAY